VKEVEKKTKSLGKSCSHLLIKMLTENGQLQSTAAQ